MIPEKSRPLFDPTFISARLDKAFPRHRQHCSLKKIRPIGRPGARLDSEPPGIA
jgi:hypothetical protein